MTLAKVVEIAKEESRRHNGLKLLILYALEQGGEEGSEYEYCSEDAKELLFPKAEVIATVSQKPSSND